MAAPSRLVQHAHVLVFGVLVAILLIIGGLTWDRFNAAYAARICRTRATRSCGR